MKRLFFMAVTPESLPESLRYISPPNSNGIPFEKPQASVHLHPTPDEVNITQQDSLTDEGEPFYSDEKPIDLPVLTQYLNTPLWRHEKENPDGTSEWEYGPSFFDELEAEEERLRINSNEIELKLWADTQKNFPTITIPQGIIDRIDAWNKENPKRQIFINREVTTVSENIVVFPDRDVAFAADE